MRVFPTPLLRVGTMPPPCLVLQGKQGDPTKQSKGTKLYKPRTITACISPSTILQNLQPYLKDDQPPNLNHEKPGHYHL